MIYFIRSGDAVKIGYAERPDKRVPTLRTANPNAIVVLGVMQGGMSDEQELHRLFARHHLRGEWFVLCDEILEYIEENARPCLVNAKPIGVLPPEKKAARGWDPVFLQMVAIILAGSVLAAALVTAFSDFSGLYAAGATRLGVFAVMAATLIITIGVGLLLIWAFGSLANLAEAWDAEQRHRKIVRRLAA